VTRVKICGVTTPEDARACAAEGADAIGMILVRASPRCITAEQAAKIVAGLPPFASSVLVMAPATASEAVSAALRARPSVLQLQGHEPPEMLEDLRTRLPGVRLVKTIHVGGGGEIEAAGRYEMADALLLDTASPAGGGSGKTHDWSVSREIVKKAGVPVILAGGLAPGNVADAVRAVRPYAVDVASGVEAGKGKKDIKLVTDFIREAKGA